MKRVHPARFIFFLTTGFLVGIAIASCLGYIREPPKGALSPLERIRPAPLIASREWFLRGLRRAVPEPEAEFVAGTLIGAQSLLSPAIKQDFSRTSTSHIIAVSGYNITIIATVLGALLVHVVHRRHAFWITALVLIIFMLMTGAQASVVRATVMGLAVLISRNVGRLATPVHTLVLVAGLMVAIDPSVLWYDIGFQLSFLATAGILIVYPLLDEAIPDVESPLMNMLRETLLMTVSAQVCVTPILMYYFKTFSLVSLPVNLLILPLVPLVMVAGLVGGFLGACAPMFAVIAGLPAYGLAYGVLHVIHFFSSLTWAVATVTLSRLDVALMYIALIGMCMLLYRTLTNKPFYL